MVKLHLHSKLKTTLKTLLKLPDWRRTTNQPMLDQCWTNVWPMLDQRWTNVGPMLDQCWTTMVSRGLARNGLKWHKWQHLSRQMLPFIDTPRIPRRAWAKLDLVMFVWAPLHIVSTPDIVLHMFLKRDRDREIEWIFGLVNTWYSCDIFNEKDLPLLNKVVIGLI